MRSITILGFLVAAHWATAQASAEPGPLAHPRLYFKGSDLPGLRELRQSEFHSKIWSNLTRSADWCAQQPVRTEWIPTATEDPQFENLYDRFYAAMHDTAIVEHLAFASILSQPEEDPYFDPARKWLLGAARVWRHEAENKPDASKAYAVLRVMKALAVGYDLLFERLSAEERQEVREAILAVGGPYYTFFQDPTTAGAGYNKHHGSVDAAPLGIMALALLGDAKQADAWLEVAIEKHVSYLLPHALTRSGTSDQSSNFWASTLQYRILFLEPLRRVTGRDLLAEFPDALPGRMALAAVAAGQPSDLLYNEDNRSVLFGPSYGQINYWSPVLLYLARRDRRPIYQHLALWDESLGSIQRTRYITPGRKEELLFCFGPYAYLWCDPSVKPAIEDKLPYSFDFPEPEVNEAYLRASYELGGIVVAMKKGAVIVHAGGRPVLVDRLGVEDLNKPAPAVEHTVVTDDGRRAAISWVGPKAAGLEQQVIQLERPAQLTIDRHCSQPLTWWCGGDMQQEGQTLSWPDGTRLTVARGEITAVDRDGYVETKTHFGGMKYADPHPFHYPTITVAPTDGRITLTVVTPQSK